MMEGPDAKYVVTNKKDGTVTYRDLDKNQSHTMVFYADTIDYAFDVYPYLHVGDTIIGRKRTLQEPVSRPWYNRFGQTTKNTSAIRSINGTEISAIQQRQR